MIASSTNPSAAPAKMIRSRLRIWADESIAAVVAPSFGVNVTGFWSGRRTTTFSPNDDCTCASSCWSITFTSTPSACSFATSSSSSLTPLVTLSRSMRPWTP